MKISKPLKICGIVALSLVFLALLINFSINYIIKAQLPKIIEDKNDTAYNLLYDDMNFSIFSNSLSIDNVTLKPKEHANIKKDIDFFGSVKRISVSGVNFYELIKNKNLKAYTISIIGPDLTVLKPTVKDTLPTQSKLSSVIDIDRISVKNAHLKMATSANDTLLHEIFNFNAEVDGIHMGTYTANKDIPFTYTDYNFKIDSVYSVVNDLQIVKSSEITVTKDDILVSNFRMLPYKTAKEFKQNQTETNTRILVDVPKLMLKHTDWGYKNSNLYVNIGTIAIDSINVRILDQKNQTVFQQAKKDAEKMIQPLIPFQLDINELNIKRSAFNSLGKLDVSNVDIKIKKISNKVKEKLTIEEFQLNNPKFVQTPAPKNTKKSSEPSKLNDVIEIKKVTVSNAQYILLDKSKKFNQLAVSNLNLHLSNIKVDDKTVLSKIPFVYSEPKLTTGNVHYDSGKDYAITIKAAEIKQANATIKGFKMNPKMSRKQHTAKLKYAADYYNLDADLLQLKNYSWGFNAHDEFFINFKEIALNNLNAHIYRNVTLPINPRENFLFSKKLRNLKFPFHLETLKIKNSSLTYEEESATSANPGKLTFTNINITASNLYSGYRRTSGAKTQINVNTKFMHQGDLVASWQFDIMDSQDRFNINGELKNFPAVAMNPFLKPYLRVQANGTIDRMSFNFSGNNSTATGDYAMNYKNLKMTLFNKENQERKLLSAAANMVVRTDTDGFKKVEIKPVERIKEKSFFNFLWQCIMQGLKQTVI